MHTKIFSSPTTNVYLFTILNDRDVKEFWGMSQTHIAIREFVAQQPLNCMKPMTIHWNKSNTASHTVVAVSTKRIGVDIEYKRERRFEKISRRYFHEHEITDNMEIFYDLWCQKEAYTKWKKGKIAENLRADIDRPMIRLDELPDNVVGYLCT